MSTTTTALAELSASFESNLTQWEWSLVFGLRMHLFKMKRRAPLSSRFTVGLEQALASPWESVGTLLYVVAVTCPILKWKVPS
jgi:hypothetical protein